MIFLGFGFHQQNMGLLRANEQLVNRLVMATKKDVHAGNDLAIKREIGVATRIGASEVALFDMGARDFLQQLRPTIMQAVGN